MRRIVTRLAALAAILPIAALPVAGPAAAWAEQCVTGGTAPTAQTPWAQRWLALGDAWPLGSGGAGVTVAVVDTGVDTRQPQLAGAVLPGTDLIASGDGRTDCTGHGTGIAALIAARPAADTGFAGVAPQAHILPVRVAERIEDVQPNLAATGIDWAAGHGARIIVLAFALPTDAPTMRAAVARAVARGILVVAAAGTDPDPRTTAADPTRPAGAGPFPAAYDGVLGVSAIDGNGTVDPSTWPGRHVDLAAPGLDVVTAAPGHGQAAYSGSDMASAVAGGVAALLLASSAPGTTPTGTRLAARLTATADPFPATRGWAYGAGIVNPVRALSEPLSPGVRRAASPVAVGPAPPAPGGGPGVRVTLVFLVLAGAALGLGFLERRRRLARR
ncbi:S8 family serine peptidase [Hamadaea tsunoensis]|uniref:S8 family serine peptidase n=1 Tax=Hamadaea tsunoensis TaxID=53368 RepID=UPI0012FAF253|nr:S8 family serine peptidase [Hamadaea tsunoensis]